MSCIFSPRGALGVFSTALSTFGLAQLGWAQTPATPTVAPQDGGLERTATPLTGDAGRGAAAAAASGTAGRANCVVEAMARSSAACPTECMIPVSLIDAASVDACELATDTAWQCQWPRQWVTEDVACDSLGFGTGWTGTATVENEYEIQQCGTVVVPTGAPRRLIETSDCRRTLQESGSMACPTDRAQLPAELELDATLAHSWQAEVARGVGWQGAGIGLTRQVTQALATDGTIRHLSTSAWRGSSAQCTRQADALLAAECPAPGQGSEPLATCENTYTGNTIHAESTATGPTWQAGVLYQNYRFWQVHGQPLTRGCAFDVRPSNPLINVDLRRTNYALTINDQKFVETPESTYTSNLQTACSFHQDNAETGQDGFDTTWSKSSTNTEGFLGNSRNNMHSSENNNDPKERSVLGYNATRERWEPVDPKWDSHYTDYMVTEKATERYSWGGLKDSNHTNPSNISSRAGGRKDPNAPPSSEAQGRSGACVLCGFYTQRGDLDRKTYIADLRYGQRHISATTMAGYHLWAVPLVKHLQQHPESHLIPLLRPVVHHWAQEMAFRMGAVPTGSRWGTLILYTIKPLCTAMGKVLQTPIWLLKHA